MMNPASESNRCLDNNCAGTYRASITTYTMHTHLLSQHCAQVHVELGKEYTQQWWNACGGATAIIARFYVQYIVVY
jgi:hypothetical protein